MIGVAVVARGEDVAGARVLARSLARHHPDWTVTAVVLPGLRPELRPGEEPFDLLTPRELTGSEHETLLTSAPSQLLAALLGPLLVARLLAAGHERVLLLAPDAEAYGPLDALVFADEADAVVMPRLTGSLPEDGRRPDGQDLLDAGEIDDGVVAVRGTEGGRALVDWWCERALQATMAATGLGEESARAAARLGASPLGAALRVFSGLVQLDDAGYDVSYWNLHERSLARTGNAVAAAGRPLRLMRWTGFRPDRPWWLSEHGTRTLVLDEPVLTELVAARARALREAGWIRLDTLAAGAGELPNGVRYDERLQRLQAEAADAGEDFGDVFSPPGAESFVSWLTEPASRGAAAGVNRYGYDVWRERPDVQSAYPDLDGEDADGFLGWLWVHGRTELALQELLLPEPPAWLEQTEQHVPAVLVSGYLRGNLGLGQAARAYVEALQAAAVPVATRSVSADPPVERLPRGARPRPEERSFADLELPLETEPEVDLLCVNGDQVAHFVEELGEDALSGRYTIGHWAWETDVVPPSWDDAFARVDELWAISGFVAENLARAADVPVVVVPLPVSAPDPAGARLPFELPGAFTFAFAFDYFSTIERKNPVGAVEAFKLAFAPGEGPGLILKTINAGFRPEAAEHVRHAAAGRDDIRVVDAALEPRELAALFAQADCYVSLHRAEGFGLTLAESMALGKPVIATGYSGNTDFMSPANSYLVDWKLREVGPDAEHYPAAGHWAEPDPEHAAALMRQVWTNQEVARKRGVRAAEDIRATLSAEAVGRIARARLVRIAARRAGRNAGATEHWPHPELPGRLYFDLEGQPATGGRARRLLRRGLFRTLRPYTTSERRLDEVVVEALRRMDLERSAERAQLERERARAALRDRQVARLAHDLAGVARRLEDAPHEQAALRATLAELDVPALRAQLDELLGAARGIPYMAGDPFTYFTDPVAGRVLGYRGDARAAVSGDNAYRAFEDVFRGPRERVRGLVEPYVDLLRKHGPVLDVGCGRGELLEALAGAGIEARGVDLDAGMVEQARRHGLDVAVADGLEQLAQANDASLGAVVSIQVIEHLRRDVLLPFLITARRKLRPGGLFVAETVNPHAAHALKTFWVDLTHQHPLFPEVMLSLAVDAGYGSAFICHLLGSGDAEQDRFRESSYALVAQV